ncbi:MAG: ZIP family metal transporter [Bacilli bacterium]|nr:ZIP family metal transporter [Bacilli bacterium]
MVLLLTLLVGFFIILGTVLVFFTNNNNKFINFSICVAFGVMISLGILEILPETYKIITEHINIPLNIFVLAISLLIGMALLKVLDKFISDHEHNHTHDHEHKLNLYHIGIVSSLMLVVHNVIEGIALYNTLIISFKSGVMMCIGIGIHNIPLGMVIASTFYKKNKSKLKTFLITLLISLSTFVGGIIAYIYVMNELLEGILLAVTLGMIIYITIFELLNQIKEIKNKKIVIIGITLGIILMIISMLL